MAPSWQFAEFSFQSVNSGGTVIKPLFVPIMVAMLLAPTAQAATKTPSTEMVATIIQKASAAKKPIVKEPQKKISPTPSPAPTWPPKGFKSNGEVFAKIPTAKELIGSASNSKILTRQLSQQIDGIPICEKYSCGAVQIASLNGCTWWEIKAKLIGRNSPGDKSIRIFGTIRALVKKTAPKQIMTVLLVSSEPLAAHHAITSIIANCHHDPVSEKIPSTTYTPIIS